ncbi:hypothetical protein acsn021_10180 [Anaerocolumna cellulosilytica]|uniref:Uncharacterized protein n=1 Tax=Anaerocolumna cellulosilytica TaxID=433286 RepID=A0A6S6QWL0_9FIRM|nr:DUF6142 family protein [Anaerocolumna cellulosilytica]MBB5194504.1 vacuolar-type H+-ATPase subunit I/STV1 [Anaerocolumna cellulosilytica]BCJ93449.1 hypothetical protein acsn021_10180 [Anaerocolumna cellulosilytica]
MLKHKKEIFKFSGRSHSVKGIVSVILGTASLLFFILLAVISSISHGNGGMAIGILGIILLVVSISGFILGIKACIEKEIYYTAPIIGMVMNGLLFLGLFLLYIVGIFM